MTDKKENYRLSRVEEACENNTYPVYFDFFDERLQMKIEDIIKHYSVQYLFFGGNENAQRQMLCIYPDYIEESALEWPICSLVFEVKGNIDHRNVLGTLMSLGISRDLLGDIDVSEKWSQIIVNERIADFITANLRQINHTKVDLKVKKIEEILVFERHFEQKEIVVASSRLDGMIGKIFGHSRQASLEMIRQKKVRLNYQEVTKKDCRISGGDIISLRGKGKARIVSMDEKTKKGNIKMIVEIYK
ncbi:YlmH/Sll1252 family protein [Eubacteriaceae bacterium ES2]|nr:YlmH/Sll1252 family protein [Eubacteriaceae bacterium ES2]